MEAQILASIAKDRSAYEYVRAFVQDTDLSERGKRIYDEIVHYYTRDPNAEHVDLDIILSSIARGLPSPKMVEQFEVAIDNIAAMDVSAANITHEFLELRRENVGHRLARSIESGDRAGLYELHEEYGELLDATEIGTEREVDIDLFELFAERLSDGAKSPLLPGVLNQVLGGGLRPGDTVVVFGRPNAGKSLFTINAVVGFINRGLRVLFIENEDSRERTLSRFVRRLIEQDIEWCKQHPEEAAQLAKAAGRERFHLYKLTPGTPNEIEALVRKVKPDVLIVNQIRAVAHNMSGGKLTPNLEKAQIAIRNIGQRYDLITFVVTQANAPYKDHHGNVVEKPIMYMEDIDSSLTGVPGATDFIIAVGTSRALREHNTVVLNVAKSKEGGDGQHVYAGVIPEIDKLTSTPERY